MPIPRPKFAIGSFAIVVKEPGPLRDWCMAHQAKHWKSAQYWVKRNGERCGIYRGILGMIFAAELERDPDGFTTRLRQAHYNL